MSNPSFVELLQKPVHLLAFGFGSGLARRAPGTFGTLAALPIFALLQPLPLWIYVTIVALAFVCGIWICGRTAEDLSVHDHPGIVWDEFVGLWVTLIAAPLQWGWILLGFVWFRIFDILKPWPIGWCDRRVKGGLGIMIDDLLAGIMGFLALQACMRLWN